MRRFHLLFRYLIACVFVLAGTVKLFFFKEFAHSIGDFGIVFDSLTYPTATTICILELFIGIGLIFASRIAVTAAIALLTVFIAVLGYAKWLGLDIDCGCFGPGYRVPLLIQMLLDIIILAGLVLVGRTFPTNQKVQ